MTYRFRQFNGVRYNGTRYATTEAIQCEVNTIQTARKFKRLARLGTGVMIFQTTGEINSLYGSAEYLRGVAQLAQTLGLDWRIIRG